MRLIKPEKILIKDEPGLGEKWVQDIIASDPSILGLGDLVLRDRERIQPRAGRLDLLLQDPDTNRRYEVEIQLGRTDESHIIRTIEYWDIERKRYPQYDHCAVIIAEDITSRFLNVVSLFNGAIPLMAIQMSALKIDDGVALTFTTVLDEVSLALVDEDEEVAEVADRAYWENRGSRETVAIADQLLKLIHEWDAALSLKYNKYYIGLEKDGQPNNFVVFRATKSRLNLEARLPQTDEVNAILDEAGLDVLTYSKRNNRYKISVSKEDVSQHGAVLADLMKRAYQG